MVASALLTTGNAEHEEEVSCLRYTEEACEEEVDWGYLETDGHQLALTSSFSEAIWETDFGTIEEKHET